MLTACNLQMSPKPFEGKVEETKKFMDRVKECNAIQLDCEKLEQSELERKCDKTAIEELQAQALEHAQNNKYGQYIPDMLDIQCSCFLMSLWLPMWTLFMSANYVGMCCM